MATLFKPVCISLLLLLVLADGSVLRAGVPPDILSHAEMVYQGTETLSLFNRPDGGGDAFTEAHLPGGGGTADATIILTVLDGFSQPIAHFPAEDLWIASVDAGMATCSGLATADRDTDAEGRTVWAEPLFAGGSSEALCVVYVNGDALTTNGGLALSFNSADIDGSGDVNLSDAGYFSGFLGGDYDYRGDFNYDGVVNVSDAGRMAAALGASCP